MCPLLQPTMHLQTHTCSLLSPSKLPQEPVLQQHHKHTLVHSIRSIFCSHQAEWDRPGDIERVPKSQGKTGKRRSCNSGNATVLPEHLSQSCEQNAPCTVGFCWKPSSSHLAPCTETLALSVFFSRCEGHRGLPLHGEGDGATD